MAVKIKNELGWQELVDLPELKIKKIKAKIDTGANLATLHARKLRIRRKDGIKYIYFDIPPLPGKKKNRVRKGEFLGYKRIKSSDGVIEKRPYIKTIMKLDGINKKIEITLTDRTNMEFHMLIGRKALGKRWLVDPSKSFKSTQKKKVTKKKVTKKKVTKKKVKKT